MDISQTPSPAMSLISQPVHKQSDRDGRNEGYQWILQRIHFARLNYISQNFICCMFTVRVGHKEDSPKILEGGREQQACRNTLLLIC